MNLLKNLYRKVLFYKNFGLTQSSVKKVLSKHVSSHWFFESMNIRKSKKNVVFIDKWLKQFPNKHVRILEVGCGVGANLLRWHNLGYKNLSGADLDKNNLKALTEIFKLQNYNIESWCESALSPLKKEKQYDIISSLNLVYLLQEFELSSFLNTYKSHISENGYLFIDLVDEEYLKKPYYKENINDLKLPKEKRRPSQYLSIYSHSQVEAICHEANFTILDTYLDNRTVTKRVYVLQKTS